MYKNKKQTVHVHWMADTHECSILLQNGILEQNGTFLYQNQLSPRFLVIKEEFPVIVDARVQIPGIVRQEAEIILKKGQFVGLRRGRSIDFGVHFCPHYWV